MSHAIYYLVLANQATGREEEARALLDSFAREHPSKGDGIKPVIVVGGH